ncbi:MAG: VWA domain-containing protein [Desulfobacterales bacterium]|nr:VWA domain-containing protein [Desulfobacterales bacterium]
MDFAKPYWLIIGFFSCVILFFVFYYFEKIRRKHLESFASKSLLPKLLENVSPFQRKLKYALLILSVFFLFMALAMPQAGFTWVEVKRKGIDILIILDSSKSMLSNDIKPNRLERSKLGIIDFISKLEGDRVGLIPFSGDAFLMCPLTMDYEIFREILNDVDVNILPKGGTDIANAIKKASDALEESSNNKILILISDGEDLTGDGIKAAKEASEKDIKIYTAGIGTPYGELIPIQNKDGGISFLKDENGNTVKSRLDEETLKTIATSTGAIYAPFGRNGEGLDYIYQHKLSLFPKQKLDERMMKVPIHRFQWPLSLALIMLFIDFIIEGRKFKKIKVPVIETAGRRLKKNINGVLFLLIGFLFFCGYADASVLGAYKDYKDGDYLKAKEKYKEASAKDPNNSLIYFNLGASAYKNNDYDEAEKAFLKTLQTTDNLSLQNNAYYNLGNTLYRQGEKTVQTDSSNTIAQWKKSLQAYQDAIKLNPKDKDSEFNYSIVKKRLEELEKQQQQKKDSEKKDDQKNCENKDSKENNEQDSQKKDEKQDDTKQTQNENQKENEKKENQDMTKDDKEKEAQNAQGKDDKPQEAKRVGEMSKEEAENLLNSLKDNEEQFIFIPQDMFKNNEEDVRRDW